MSKKEENLSHVKCLEVLVNTFHSHLMDIDPETAKERRVLDKAVEYLASYERNQLYKLRKVFEQYPG